jgi:integrase
MKGTVFRHGPTWKYQFPVVQEGRRRWVSKSGFRTKKDAEAALSQALAAHAQGGPVLVGKATLAGYARDEWLPVVRHALKPTTYLNYESMLEQRILPHVGDVRLGELGPAAIARCYAALRKNGRRDGKGGLSETSIEHTHRLLHKVLSDAVRAGLLHRNPADRVIKPRRRQREMRVWTSEQVRTFLDYTADHRLGPLFTLAAMTGMRRGELLGLEWDDIDLGEGTVTVRRARVAVGYRVSAGTPKSGEGRLIDLDERTVAALRAWRKRQREERLAAGSEWVDTASVFTDEFGRPLHPHAVFGYFERAVRDSGLPLLNFHGLRHSHATVLLQAAVPVRVVAERLGHADPAMTLRVYQHVVPGMQRQAAARAAEMIFGP